MTEAADWTQLADEQLLERRIARLGLRLDGSGLPPLIQQLHNELAAHGLVFLPTCFLADEWFVPVGIPAIGIPFYLAHERLRKLEQTIMLEVEGGTPDWFMKLMRHEAGHAYSYAYRLYQRKKWQEHFGLASEEYKDTYRPRPHSRSFVIHLDNWYGQAHPDEDFAETFAVWLTPGLDWRARYAGWKALAKLEYVDELMRSLVGRMPLHQPTFRAAEYAGLNLKLKTYYARKRKLYEEDYPDLHDNDLKRLFHGGPEGESASHYLRAHRRALREAVCQWTKEKKYTVDQLLRQLIDRAHTLGLRVPADGPRLHAHLVAYLTTLVMNYLFTGKFKRRK